MRIAVGFGSTSTLAWGRSGASPRRLPPGSVSRSSSGIGGSGSAARSAAPGTVLSIDGEALRIALDGGVLRAARVRGDGAKESAKAWAERAGVRAGERVENG